MKKKILIILGVIVVISLIVFICIRNNNYNGDKFYLTDKYYNNGDNIVVKASDINKVIDDKESFIVYVHNNFCAFSVPCGDVFKEVISKYKVDMLEIMFNDFKDTSLYKKVKYAPSVVIVKDGKIIDYLDAEDDKDLDKYQDVTVFENWLKKYIILEK